MEEVNNTWWGEYINAVAKGKGKGFQGSCYNCGEFGHSIITCPKTRINAGKVRAIMPPGIKGIKEHAKGDIKEVAGIVVKRATSQQNAGV